MNFPAFRFKFFILAVFFLASCAGTHAVTITRVIGTGDPMPDRSDTVFSVGNPVFDNSSAEGQAVVVIESGTFPSTISGLYRLDRANTFQRVVASDTPRPGGGTMDLTPTTFVTVRGDAVYFIEVNSMTFATSLYKVSSPGAVPVLIAAQGDPAPGGKFLIFTGVTAHPGGVLFEAIYQASGGDSWVDVFSYDGQTISGGLLGKLRTPAPGASGYQVWNESGVGVQASGQELICLSSAYSSLAFPPVIQGLYGFPLPASGTQPRKIADTLTTVPGLTPGPGNVFALPDLSQQLPDTAFDTDGTRSVFLGKTQGNAAPGVYEWDGTQLRVVADGTTLRPGSSDPFKFSGARYNEAAVAVSGGKIVFRARDVNDVTGIFVKEGATLETVVVDGQQVSGVDLFGVGLTRHGFQGDQVLFTASSSLWRATLGAAPPAGVRLTVQQNGSSGQVTWDAQASGAGAVLEETPSHSPTDWKPVQNQSNPYPFTFDGEARFFRLRQ